MQILLDENTRFKRRFVRARKKKYNEEMGIYFLKQKFQPAKPTTCHNPTLAKCGGEAQHLEKVRTWSPLGLPNV